MFFERINEMIGDNTFNLTVQKKDDKLTVLFIPKTGKTVDSQLAPLSVTGTAAELDANFLTVAAAAVHKVTDFVSNLDEFNKTVDAAKKKTIKTTPEQKKSATKAETSNAMNFDDEKEEPEEEGEEAAETATPERKPAEKMKPASKAKDVVTQLKDQEPIKEVAEKKQDDEPQTASLPGSGNDTFGEEDW